MKRVLVVDEDIMMQKALKRIVESRKGYRVVACLSDGEDALKYCKSHTPDLIFMDLKVHECTGLGIVRQVRKLYPEVDICILSVYQNLEFVRQALDLKVKHYLLKPVSTQSIYQVLEEEEEDPVDYSDLVALFQEIIESKDYKKVYENSHAIAERIAQVAAGDKDVAENILKTVERELMNQYMENPFDDKQGFDAKVPKNKELLSDSLVMEMWVTKILDYIFKYRFSKRYSSVAGVLQYVDEHIKEPIVMSEIVDNCHICQQYLLRIFKEQLGMSTRDYIQYRKIMLAKWYLYLGDYPTLDIAMKLGYEDSGYFAKVFKKLEHVTPYQYRLNCNPQPHKLAVE